MFNYRKFKKLVNKPEIFFRDFLIKKYPVMNTELNLSEQDEQAVIRHHLSLLALEEGIYTEDIQPVDVVFTWVNHLDPRWQSCFLQYSKDHQLKKDNLATNIARFENHDELFYALESVKQHLPWVRHIYIITDNQTPDWFVPSERVSLVFHQDIIEQQYLPTFNSHVIEAHLHKIDGLSEQFIYFNDDVFVAQTLPKTHFFHSNGLVSLFLANKSLQAMYNKGVYTPTLSASKNVQQLLSDKFSAHIDTPLVHTYVPLKKSTFNQVWDEFHDEIHQFLANKFRANNDLNLATFLVPWYAYLSQQAVITPEVCYYFNIRSSHALQQYKRLLIAKKQGKEPNSFCINDFSSDCQIDNYQDKLKQMLKIYFSSHS